MNKHYMMHLPSIADCPFCHGEVCMINSNSGGRLHWVSCEGCAADGPCETDEESAILIWNGVAEDIQALRNDCERLRRELDECMGVIR